MTKHTEKPVPAQPKSEMKSDGALHDQVLDQVTGGEIMSNVSKTRSEISMTFARNSRA